MKIILMLLIPGLAFSGIGEPQAGWMRSADGAVRPLYGVAGSFIPGDVIATGSSRAAYSGVFGAIKLARSIRLSDGTEFEAPEGDAVFGPGPDSSSIAAFFPSTGSAGIITVAGIKWLNIDSRQLGGDVRALSGSTFYVNRADGLHAVAIRLTDGAIESDNALGIRPKIAIALNGGILVYSRPASAAPKHAELMIRASDGTETGLELGAPLKSLNLMNSDLVQVTLANGRSQSVRIRPGGVSLFEIPEVAQ
jgi:hypothetical protein